MAGSRGRYLNLLMAISPTVAVLYHEIVIGQCERFEQFLHNLSEVIGQKSNATIIMDNEPFDQEAATILAYVKLH